MKKTIMVSNSWRPEKSNECSVCGTAIEYAWGDYSFRYYEKKDKSDLCVICKSCAAEMTNKDRKIRIVNRSPIMDMINLRNSGWKSQPSAGEFPSSAGRGKPDSSDDKNTQE